MASEVPAMRMSDVYRLACSASRVSRDSSMSQKGSDGRLRALWAVSVMIGVPVPGFLGGRFKYNNME